MKNKFLKSTIALSAFLLMFSCKDDDNTGQSTLTPTSPLISVTLDFSDNQNFIETESTFDFTVNLSEPQVVNVQVNIAQTAGTATDGADFTIPHSITIPAGATSASGSIAIHSDELIEDTETAEITIGLGNEANADTTSQVVNFTIQNLTADDLVIDLSWMNQTTITDNLGNEIAAEDLADMELLIVDTAVPYTTEYLVVDEEFGFETMLFSAAYPDGEYHIAARFYDAADYGSAYTNLDMTLEFNQTGTINNEMVTIPAALNTEFASCQTALLAKVTKSGATYVIEPVGLNNSLPLVANTFVGDYNVVTTTAGQFGPAFDQMVTLVDEGSGKRSFVGDWNGFGVDQTWEMQFNGICGTITFIDGQDTGLGCGTNILHGSSSNAGGFDAADDTTLVVVYTENTNSQCGGVPTEVTITFTKI